MIPLEYFLPLSKKVESKKGSAQENLLRPKILKIEHTLDLSMITENVVPVASKSG